MLLFLTRRAFLASKGDNVLEGAAPVEVGVAPVEVGVAPVVTESEAAVPR